jgi:CheY-like chemotaxis protein
MSDKQKILVVEDNDFVRMQIVRYLSEEGSYEVVEASRGDEALDVMDKSFAAAVVDVRMEPIDGFEFVRSVKGLELDVAVILVTGDQNPDLLNEAGKWGVSAVLIKPVQRDRLVKAVERIVKQKRQAT